MEGDDRRWSRWLSYVSVHLACFAGCSLAAPIDSDQLLSLRGLRYRAAAAADTMPLLDTTIQPMPMQIIMVHAKKMRDVSMRGWS